MNEIFECDSSSTEIIHFVKHFLVQLNADIFFSCELTNVYNLVAGFSGNVRAGRK